MKVAAFCVECHLPFGLVDRSAVAPSTCAGCIAKMKPSYFGECERCKRIIEIGEKFHLEWVKFCGRCVKELRKEEERERAYPRNTVAR